MATSTTAATAKTTITTTTNDAPVSSSYSSSSSSSSIAEIKEGLERLRQLEDELSKAKWQETPSPRGVDDSLLQRYIAARNLYLKRRMESMLVEQVCTFDPSTGTFECLNKNDDNDADADNEEEEEEMERTMEIQQRHAKALGNLETTVQKIQAQVAHLRDGYHAIKSRREEMERMLRDMEKEQEKGEKGGNNSNNRSNKRQKKERFNDSMDSDAMDEDDDDDNDDDNNNNDEEINEEDLELEQERIDELQKTKRRLEEQLAALRQQNAEVDKRIQYRQQDIEMLEQQHNNNNNKENTTNNNNVNNNNNNSNEDMKKKIQELLEMKLFYDSLREVLEELSGVKIEKVYEGPSSLPLSENSGKGNDKGKETESDNTKKVVTSNSKNNMHLILILYDEYKVEIELEVYNRRLLKLVHAKWVADPPIVGDESFSLPLQSLDDLVQVAKTTLGPPHDLRFIVRESLARLRIQRDRLSDLSILRQNILTKVVNGDQVVCSLNDGIVVVMRLYEHWVRVEQVIGINGWDEETTKKIHSNLMIDEDSTPTSVIEQVQKEVERLVLNGNVSIGETPTLPKRGGKK